MLRLDALQDIVKGSWLSGFLLGPELPTTRDQENQTLNVGDELLLSSDGLLDQFDLTRDKACVEQFEQNVRLRMAGVASLHEALVGWLNEALLSQAQADDLTLVGVTRK